MTQTHVFKPWNRDNQFRIYIERIEPEGAPKPTTSLGYLDVNRDTHEMSLVEVVAGTADEMRGVVARSLAITPSASNTPKPMGEDVHTPSAAQPMGEAVSPPNPAQPEQAAAAKPKPPNPPSVPVVKIRPHAYTDLAITQPGASIMHLLGENKTYRQGLVGEQRTAGVLSPLQNLGWKVLNSIRTSQNKDLDHLLIGPVGVLAISTKTSTYSIVAKDARVTTNGYEQNWLDSIRRDAEVASRLLTHACGEQIDVRGIVVGWSPLDVISSESDVIDGMELAETLQRLPQVLDQSWIDSIFDRARRDTTWSAVLE